MFVLERYQESRQRKLEQWERAREKWIGEDKYGYRQGSVYESTVCPRPGYLGRNIVRGIKFFVPVILVSGVLIFLVITPDPEGPAKTGEAKNCKEFNLEDHVRIQRGDYASLNGTIVGGCADRVDYQVKLDEHEPVNLAHDGVTTPVSISGDLISVDSSRNLAIIQK